MDGGRVYGLRAYDFSTGRVDGGEVTEELIVYDSATATMSAGEVRGLSAHGDSTSNVTMTGGTTSTMVATGFAAATMTGGTTGSLAAAGSATVTMSGGTAGALITFESSSVLRVRGTNFEVDGVPVPYGDLTAQTGTLTGTLESGDPMNSVFFRGGGETGTITLIFTPPVPGLSTWGYLALVSFLIGFGLVYRRRVAR